MRWAGGGTSGFNYEWQPDGSRVAYISEVEGESVLRVRAVTDEVWLRSSDLFDRADPAFS